MAEPSLRGAVRDIEEAPGSVVLVAGDEGRLRDLVRSAARALMPVTVVDFARGADDVAADLDLPPGNLAVLPAHPGGARARPAEELDALLLRLPAAPGAVVVDTLAHAAETYGAAAAERFARAVAAYGRESVRTVVLVAPRGRGPLDLVLPDLEVLADRIIEV